MTRARFIDPSGRDVYLDGPEVFGAALREGIQASAAVPRPPDRAPSAPPPWHTQARGEPAPRKAG